MHCYGRAVHQYQFVRLRFRSFLSLTIKSLRISEGEYLLDFFSGFGCFMEEHVSDPMSYGIYVVDRHFKSGHESIDQMTTVNFNFA